MDEQTVTLYRCAECGAVDSHELSTHILRDHRPGGPFREKRDDDDELIEDLQQRIEIPVEILTEHITEAQ